MIWSTRTGLLVIFAFLSLLWPAILNTQYLFYPDSASYVRGGASVFKAILGIDSVWLDANIGQIASLANAPGIAEESYVIAGRSIYYGSVLFLGDLLSSLWLAVAFQALCLGVAIILTIRAVCAASLNSALAVVIVLGLFTSASFYASYLMPDVFTGIAILAVGNLTVLHAKQNRATRVLWFVLLTIAVISHSSHVLLVLGLLVIGAGFVLISDRCFVWTGLAIVGVALIFAIAGEVAFFAVVEHMYGVPPLRPPFLMARIIDDGPGFAYLQARCPDAGFRVCDFINVLPLPSDSFLWSTNPAKGVYYASDVATRRALSGEQFKFVIETLKFDPLGQIMASFTVFVEQLSRFSLMEFQYVPKWIERLPTDQAAAMAESPLFRGTFPLSAIDMVFNAVIAISMAAVALMGGRLALSDTDLTTPADRRVSQASMIAFIALVLLGIILNAGITGVLSTPHDRYQARVIWLLVLSAIVLALWLWRPSGNKSRSEMNGVGLRKVGHVK